MKKQTIKNILRGTLWAFIAMIVLTAFAVIVKWEMDFLIGWISSMYYAKGARIIKEE